jgi:hypothetical protein
MALIHSNSLKQLRMVRKLMKGTDLGDKIKGDNLLDHDIETYEDFLKNNKTKTNKVKSFNEYFVIKINQPNGK